jgi:hypothetical protein
MAPLAFRRTHLADIARDLASRQLASDAYQDRRTIEPFHAQVPGDRGADWSAAFVAHCVQTAGLDLPRGNIPEVPHASATVLAWIAWASLPATACYYPASAVSFAPDIGDLIVFDDLVGHGPQDHMGVIVDQTEHAYLTAEGNVKNRTGIFVRRKDRQISGYILLAEADEAPDTVVAARVQQRHAAALAPRGYGWSTRGRSTTAAQRIRAR